QSDIEGETVDLGRNLLREIGEETGLTVDDFEADAGWITVLAGPRIAQMKMLRARESAEALRERILAYLRSQAEPGRAGNRVGRGPSDCDPKMPPFVVAFLSHIWNGRTERSE